MPRVAIIQENVGKKTTIKNIIQINKLAGASERIQNNLAKFCCTYATKSKYVVFFVKIGLLLCRN
jgi:hypothetical protein